MRILTNHQGVEISVITADRSAGQEFKSIYPQFSFLKVAQVQLCRFSTHCAGDY